MSETGHMTPLEQRLSEAVDRLFVNGLGERAARLVLMSVDRRDLGGWSRVAAFDRMLEVLSAGASTAERLSRVLTPEAVQEAVVAGEREVSPTGNPADLEVATDWSWVAAHLRDLIAQELEA